MAIPTAAEEPKATVKYAEIVGGETPHHQAQELAASLCPSDQHLEYTWAKQAKEGW